MQAESTYSFVKRSAAERQRSAAMYLLLACGVGGLLFRFWLTAYSIGCNDADIWLEHARLIAKHGVSFAYQHPELESLQYNHPPLMGYLSLWADHATGGDLRAFSVFMKVPGLLAELLSAWLLWKIRSKQGAIAGASVVAGYGLSLTQIEVAGFHCNTDAAYAGLSLLAFYLMHEKRSPGLSGLALAAALNVKLLPIFVAPALLSQCRSWRELRRFVAASSLAIVPYVPFLVTVPKELYRNVVQYNSQQLEWGISMFLKQANEHSALLGRLNPLIMQFASEGRWLILAAIVTAGLLSFACSRRFAYHAGALAWALFLVLTPGWGVQYAVCVVPLLFAVNVRTGVLYSTLAGVMLFFIYTEHMDFRLPLHGYVQYYPFPKAAVLFGLLAWVTLLRFVIVTTRELAADATDWTAMPQG